MRLHPEQPTRHPRPPDGARVQQLGHELLDTNIFVLGFLDAGSPEARLLAFLESASELTLVFSNDLEQQIRRVGKRLQNSDWVGLLLHYIWSTFRVDYIYEL